MPITLLQALYLLVVCVCVCSEVPVNLLSYGLIIKTVVLHLCSTLSRQWHRRLGVTMVARASSVFGTFRVADVVIPSLTIQGQCRVLPSLGMIASSSLSVSTITLVHHSIIVSFSDKKHFNKIQINVSMTVNEVTLLLLNFFFLIGDYSDPVVALWSRKTFHLLSSVTVSGPVHDTAFSPSAASQLAFVGSNGVYFCFIHTQGSDVDLKVINTQQHISEFKKIIGIGNTQTDSSIACCRCTERKHQLRLGT